MSEQLPHVITENTRLLDRLANVRTKVDLALGSAALAFGLAPQAAEAHVTEPDRAEPADVWRATFNGDHLASTWQVIERNTNPEAQEWSQFSPMNVKLRNGKLVLLSRRHCITSLDEPLTLANDTQGVCPPGTLTTYSSGRVQTEPFIKGDFTLEFKVRLSESGVRGFRRALWALNDPYCTDDPGSKTYLRELDGLEWYSSTPHTATSTTHVGCNEGEIDASHHKRKIRPEKLKGWHLVRITVHNKEVSYYLDDTQVGSTDTKEDFKKTNSREYDQAFAGSMAIIMNTEVFTDLDAKANAFRGPNPNKPFPIQKMLIDEVVHTPN